MNSLPFQPVKPHLLVNDGIGEEIQHVHDLLNLAFGGTGDVAVVPSTTQSVARSNLALRAAIMISSDSTGAGGASVMDNSTNSWRYSCYKSLRAVRGNLVFLGDQCIGVYDNRGALPSTANPPGDSDFGDWRCASTGGHTLAQIDAEATAVEATQGHADVYVLGCGGENDLQAGIIAGHTNAVIVAAILAGMKTYCTHRPRTARAILIYPMTPHGVGLASYVQSNIIQEAVNAALPAAVASWGLGNVCFMASSVGSLTQSDLRSDGQHMDLQGLARQGREIADAILQFVGMGGKPDGRKPQQRLAAPRVSLTSAQAAYIADPTGLICPSGQQSVSIGIVLYPTSLAGLGWIFYAGSDLAPTGVHDGSGLCLLAGGGGDLVGDTCLTLYLEGVAYYVPNDALRAFTVNYIAVTVDQNLGIASIYCLRPGPDGRLVQTLVSQVIGVPKLTWPAAARVNFGALLGLNNIPGLRGDLWIANGTVATVDQLEEWYESGALPPGAVYYPLNDGSGGSFAPAPAMSGLIPAGATNGTWSAAGLVAEPTHRGQGSTPWSRPQAGIYQLPTTFTTGTVTLTDSDVVDEAQPAWNYAKVLYISSVLTGPLVVNVPPDPGHELIIDSSASTLGGHTIVVNGLSVGAAVSTAYFNPAGTLTAT